MPPIPDELPRLRDSLLHDPPSPGLYTLSLHDALPILLCVNTQRPLFWLMARAEFSDVCELRGRRVAMQDRKSTRLNSSHSSISYAVFCFNKREVTARRIFSAGVWCHALVVGGLRDTGH